MKSMAEGDADFFITDSDYLSYRLKLTNDAMNDPLIKKRIEDGISIEEMKKISELVKAEIEPKLKIYREKHNLDENGAKK